MPFVQDIFLMKRTYPAVFFFLAVLFQAAPSWAADYAASPVWDDLVQKEGEGYRLSVPAAWRNMDMTSYGLAEFFEASGRILPASHDGAPVIVTVFLSHFGAPSLDGAKRETVEGYGQNPDRVFPDDLTHEERQFTLKGSQPAYLVNTRFYRKSKGLHQSRFDLMAFSEKSQTAYLYTLSVQYYDGSYGLEEEFQLRAIAEKLFGYFELE
jgi:hypothetical protein